MRLLPPHLLLALLYLSLPFHKNVSGMFTTEVPESWLEAPSQEAQGEGWRSNSTENSSQMGLVVVDVRTPCSNRGRDLQPWLDRAAEVSPAAKIEIWVAHGCGAAFPAGPDRGLARVLVRELPPSLSTFKRSHIAKAFALLDSSFSTPIYVDTDTVLCHGWERALFPHLSYWDFQASSLWTKGAAPQLDVDVVWSASRLARSGGINRRRLALLEPEARTLQQDERYIRSRAMELGLCRALGQRLCRDEARHYDDDDDVDDDAGVRVRVSVAPQSDSGVGDDDGFIGVNMGSETDTELEFDWRGYDSETPSLTALLMRFVCVCVRACVCVCVRVCV